MTELPGPAIETVAEALADLRDMLVRLFRMSEEEAVSRVADEVWRLRGIPSWGPDWLLDPEISSMFTHDGPFKTANRLYWETPNWHEAAPAELVVRGSPDQTSTVGPSSIDVSGDMPSDKPRAVAEMMTRLFALSHDEAEGRVREFLRERGSFPGERHRVRNWSFYWAHNVYWEDVDFESCLADDLIVRDWRRD